jgi:hypothetical protein
LRECFERQIVMTMLVDLRGAGPRRGRRAAISADTAEPGSASEDALNLLASWAATLDQVETAHTKDGT